MCLCLIPHCVPFSLASLCVCCGCLYLQTQHWQGITSAMPVSLISSTITYNGSITTPSLPGTFSSKRLKTNPLFKYMGHLILTETTEADNCEHPIALLCLPDRACHCLCLCFVFYYR